MVQQLLHFWQTVLGVIFRHPVIGVSIIPILDDGRIILVKRRDNQQWSFPGGFVDWGETLAETVHRELEEETGLRVKQMGRLVGVYSAPDRDSRLHSICVAIEAQVEGDYRVQEAEILEIQAFLPDDVAQEKLSHDHDRQFQDYRQGKTALA
ncbi:ADP-ribose pyrophosphatase [Acaryochloris thomasi RCC1774]|uniref:ADP-ribose pyrophosphatase n=1 Tax=Acaryochloris thomasi RCC1774 TaxID=1764569 RepID=A0A2W1JRT4_9CYAN|nr:NUDIX hydrolase [Acaryochloris thomasi]PZD73975.1 ADP-ribose pyrophosphatase [Acaryochloris thomasi RCC1774]